MTQVYLKDGRVADLVTKTEKGYLVDPYMTFKYYEDNEESAPSGQIELVQEVFTEAPKELIEAECQKVYDRLSIISAEKEQVAKELSQLKSEVLSLTNQKTNISRYIINREELRTAKRLIVWPKDQIVPRIMDGGKSHKFTVSYEISQYQNEEKCWVYQLWSENRDHNWSSSDYFDAQYGIKTDLTDDEILTISLERVSKKPENFFNEYNLKATPDKWLTPELIERKNKLIAIADERELETAKKRLKEAQDEIEKLTTKTNQA